MGLTRKEGARWKEAGVIINRLRKKLRVHKLDWPEPKGTVEPETEPREDSQVEAPDETEAVARKIEATEVLDLEPEPISEAKAELETEVKPASEVEKPIFLSASLNGLITVRNFFSAVPWLEANREAQTAAPSIASLAAGPFRELSAREFLTSLPWLSSEKMPGSPRSEMAKMMAIATTQAVRAATKSTCHSYQQRAKPYFAQLPWENTQKGA